MMEPLPDFRAGEITALLRAWQAGDQDAYRRVSSILYGELKRRAAYCLRGDRMGDAIQTTALVQLNGKLEAILVAERRSAIQRPSSLGTVL